MEKEYPYLLLPEDTECIFEKVHGFFYGRADSDVYLSANKKNLYKSYDYSPYELSLYHALHDWCAENITIALPNDWEIQIDGVPIKNVTVSILPLFQDQIFRSKNGTITTPTYIPGQTLHDMIENNAGKNSGGYARFVGTICQYVSTSIGKKLKLPHINFYPRIGIDNTKYKIYNNTLHILITDIGGPEFGVYDLIREMKQHYGNPILKSIIENINHNQTTQSNEIIELFLQNNPQTT